MSSPIAVHDSSITHHIIDRPKLPVSFNAYPKSREYVQPQWIFDSSNFRFMLPVKKYSVGAALPPHLSPWVNDDEEGYKPAYKEQIEKMKNGELLSEDEDADIAVHNIKKSSKGIDQNSVEEEESDKSEDQSSSEEEHDTSDEEVEESKEIIEKRRKREDDEAKELAKLMMSKKAKRLYGRMQHGIAEKKAKVDILKRKREEIEQTREKNKTGKTVNKQKVERLKKERRDLEKEYDNGATMKSNRRKSKGKN